MRPWRPAIRHALYGPTGFFVADSDGPAAHFRTSAHASPLFAQAICRLVGEGKEVVDVGAGRGELVKNIRKYRKDLKLTAVDLAERPGDLPDDIAWRQDIPTGIDGLLIATEWLDNVPVDVAEVDGDGVVRLVLVGEDGGEELGPAVVGHGVDPRDGEWLDRWWPITESGQRAEIGWPRDDAWASAVAAVDRGMAVAVDYGHTRDSRPAGGTLTGYRRGRQVRPVPDGSCDLTAHVAVDAIVAAATAGRPARSATLTDQREALHRLGLSARRPDLSMASRDPVGYLRALERASQVGELVEAGGLGGQYWVCVSI
jgi:SAM-dependent MidA family methyltransferase